MRLARGSLLTIAAHMVNKSVVAFIFKDDCRLAGAGRRATNCVIAWRVRRVVAGATFRHALHHHGSKGKECLCQYGCIEIYKFARHCSHWQHFTCSRHGWRWGVETYLRSSIVDSRSLPGPKGILSIIDAGRSACLNFSSLHAMTAAWDPNKLRGNVTGQHKAQAMGTRHVRRQAAPATPSCAILCIKFAAFNAKQKRVASQPMTIHGHVHA